MRRRGRGVGWGGGIERGREWGGGGKAEESGAEGGRKGERERESSSERARARKRCVCACVRALARDAEGHSPSSSLFLPLPPSSSPSLFLPLIPLPPACSFFLPIFSRHAPSPAAPRGTVLMGNQYRRSATSSGSGARQPGVGVQRPKGWGMGGGGASMVAGQMGGSGRRWPRADWLSLDLPFRARALTLSRPLSGTL